jgi:hypothetical protein
MSRKLNKHLLPEKEKIMKNIRPKSQPPSRVPAKRCEEEEFDSMVKEIKKRRFDPNL